MQPMKNSTTSCLTYVVMATALLFLNKNVSAQYSNAKIGGIVQYSQQSALGQAPIEAIKVSYSENLTYPTGPLQNNYTYTTAQGAYDFQIHWYGSTPINITVTVEFSNSNFKFVYPDSLTYTMSATVVLHSGDDITKNFVLNFSSVSNTMEQYAMEKFFPVVWNSLAGAANLVSQNSNLTMPRVTLKAATSGVDHSYNGTSKVLKINFTKFMQDRQGGYIDQTAYHEYGHAIQAQALGYGALSNDCDFHKIGSKAGLTVSGPFSATCSFAEGWADFFAVYAKYNLSDSNSSFRSRPTILGSNIEIYGSGVIKDSGIFDEGRIAAGLWDFYDAPTDFNYQADTSRKISFYDGYPTLINNLSTSNAADNSSTRLTFQQLLNPFISIGQQGGRPLITIRMYYNRLKSQNGGTSWTQGAAIAKYNYWTW